MLKRFLVHCILGMVLGAFAGVLLVIAGKEDTSNLLPWAVIGLLVVAIFHIFESVVGSAVLGFALGVYAETSLHADVLHISTPVVTAIFGGFMAWLIRRRLRLCQLSRMVSRNYSPRQISDRPD